MLFDFTLRLAESPTTGALDLNWVLLFLATVGFVIVVFFTDMAEGIRARVALLVVGLLALFGGLGGYAAQVVSADADSKAVAAAAQAKDDAAVISWLDSDYGIKVDGDALRQLYDGDALVVDYDGGDTLIEFVDRADGGLAVRIPDGRLLAPLGE